MITESSRLTAKDALFHQPLFGEPTWLETNWFSFTIPEENLRCHIYSAFRTNIGVVYSIVMIWSGDCYDRHDFDYYDAQIHLPMPTSNLDDYRLANGLHVRATEALQRYEITYDGHRDVAFELEAVGAMPAIDSRETVTTGGQDFSHFHAVKASLTDRIGHIDQTLQMRGELRMYGKTYAIDYPSNRDHSWSPRPEYGHGCGNFDEGYFGDLTFHVQTLNSEAATGAVSNGYLIDKGELILLKDGIGIYETNGWEQKSLRYELEDERGKSFVFTGKPTATARPLPTFPNQYNIGALTKWEHEGEQGWGEYKWHWEVDNMRGRKGW